MTPSTTNTAAREVVQTMRVEASLQKNTVWIQHPTFLAWIEKLDAALTQQQGGEQEAQCTDPTNCRRCSEDATTPHAGIPRGEQEAGDIQREYEAWCAPRMNNIDPDHPSDAFKAGYLAALRSKQPAASEGVDSEICMRLLQIVEGGGLTWRDSSGNHRLKDTPDWVAFYCATKNAREREASANTSKQAAGEAVELARLRARIIEAHTGENVDGCGMTNAEIAALQAGAP